MALFEDRSFFGLDIGAAGIRLAHLRASGAKPDLVTYGSVAMPPGLFQSDSDLDRQNLAGIIKQLVKKTKVGKNVVASLPGAQVYTAVVKVPKISHSELASAIKWQAEQHVPLGLNEVKIDWNVLPSAQGATEQEVLIVAAPIVLVEKYAKVLEMAELELVALEINPIATARAIVPKGEVPSVVVDIGGLTTDIAVVDENVVRLVRSTQVGGEAFTRAVSKALGLETAQAEQFKQKFGMIQDKLEGQVVKALKTIISTIVDEIERAVSFYKQQRGIEIGKIFLTGGSAKLPELPLYLASELNLEVQLANPWAAVSYHSSIQPQLNEIALDYATAVGLAMRGMK